MIDSSKGKEPYDESVKYLSYYLSVNGYQLCLGVFQSRDYGNHLDVPVYGDRMY